MVGLPAVKDGVHQATLRVRPILHAVVRRVVVVVVEQGDGLEQPGVRAGQPEVPGGFDHPELDGPLGQGSWTRSRPQIGQVPGGEELPKSGDGKT